MPGNYNYNELPTLHESSDIVDYIDAAWADDHVARNVGSGFELGPISGDSRSRASVDTTFDRKDTTRKSIASSTYTEDTYTSKGSSSALIKVKHGWKKGISRIRRKPLPQSAPGLLHQHPAAEIEPAKIRRGVWKDQLLIDRSLRSMSLLMTSFAIGMIVVICVYAKDYRNRHNKTTSSVGGDKDNCAAVTRKNTALLLLINVAATMILGMSNTYQQLITSLKTSDLAHMLRKYGDSRVGTNSPWNINKKRNGKGKAWAAWLLLVCTSIPIHFLANSMIGPSYIIEPPPSLNTNPNQTTRVATPHP